jgi:diaminopimelate epimerase
VRTIPFEKVHGLGNDFVLVDALGDAALGTHAWSDLAPALCDRHTGVGADGVLVLTPATRPGTHARMRIFNADGGDGGMCGNGIRCAARHLVEAHGVKPPLVIEVGERDYRVDVRRRDGAFVAARAAMGVPALAAGGPEPVPADLRDACARAAPGWATVCGLDDRFGRIAMPNPHAVFFVADVARVPLEVVGPVIERHSLFPDRTNAQFVQVLGPGHLRVRTWERGSGITRACGTGACAALVAAHLAGLCGRQAAVDLPGGTLDIAWREDGCVEMEGPAARVFSGVWNPPAQSCPPKAVPSRGSPG